MYGKGDVPCPAAGRGGGPAPRVAVEAALQKGRNQIQAELPLENPALWWPTGQGAQPLYELESTLHATDKEGRLVTPPDGSARDPGSACGRSAGNSVPGAPADFINPLKLVVNGRPVRQMGSNLIPPDSLFGRIDQRGPSAGCWNWPGPPASTACACGAAA